MERRDRPSWELRLGSVASSCEGFQNPGSRQLTQPSREQVWDLSDDLEIFQLATPSQKLQGRKGSPLSLAGSPCPFPTYRPGHGVWPGVQDEDIVPGSPAGSMSLKSTIWCHSVFPGEHSQLSLPKSSMEAHETRSLRMAAGPVEEDSHGPRLGQGLSLSFSEQAGGQATHFSSALWEALVSVHRAWTLLP